MSVDPQSNFDLPTNSAACRGSQSRPDPLHSSGTSAPDIPAVSRYMESRRPSPRPLVLKRENPAANWCAARQCGRIPHWLAWCYEPRGPTQRYWVGGGERSGLKPELEEGSVQTWTYPLIAVSPMRRRRTSAHLRRLRTMAENSVGIGDHYRSFVVAIAVPATNRQIVGCMVGVLADPSTAQRVRCKGAAKRYALAPSGGAGIAVRWPPDAHAMASRSRMTPAEPRAPEVQHEAGFSSSV